MEAGGKEIQVEGTRGLQMRWLVGTEGRRLQRPKMRGLGGGLGVGVGGRACGDTTTVDRTKGKGLRGKTK